MKKGGTRYTVVRFRSTCVPLIVFSIFILLFVAVTLMGVKFPLNVQGFESTTALKILSVSAGILGIIAGVLGIQAAGGKNSAKLRFCAMLGLILIIIFCTVMILSDGYTNPHAWLMLGTMGIIPSCFCGNALRLIRFGWDD